MLRKFFGLCIVCMVFFTVQANAQESNDATVKSIEDYNNGVNQLISQGELFYNRLNINTMNKVWGGMGNYSETLNFYFSLKNGEAVLKKIIVTRNILGKQIYAD